MKYSGKSRKKKEKKRKTEKNPNFLVLLENQLLVSIRTGHQWSEAEESVESVRSESRDCNTNDIYR